MPPRKRRINHNEIEKRRRDQQRLKLEELQQLLPDLRNEKASFLDIISGAINYIKILEGRSRGSRPAVVQSQQPFFFSAPAEPHTMAGDTLVSFFNGMLAPGPTPAASPLKNVHSSDSRSSSPPLASAAPLSPRKASKLFSVPAENEHVSRQRRESSILLPTNDPAKFVFGKRDSQQNSLSALFPLAFDDINTGTTGAIKCGKCTRGVDNLIMIDCDRCQSWYHIRCVGIDPTQIPFQWTCSECGGGSVSFSS